jgi:hypothetical protein
MAGLIKTTQGAQVAQELERRISSGKFAPGRKMPSTRELAAKFGVSQQVVKSALGMLAQRSLIVRKPRVGIFVNPKNVSHNREYSLLSSRNTSYPDRQDYASQLLSVSTHELWQNLNLSTRLISSSAPELVQYELDKIRAARPDCLLTHIYLPELADFLAEMPFPVVILGDVEEEQVPAVRPFNQIVENTAERAAFMVRAAADSGCREVALVAGGDPERSWGKNLREGGEQEAAARGVRFRYVRHRLGQHDETVQAAMAGGQTDGLLIDGFCNIGCFVQKLREVAGAQGKTCRVFADGEMYPGTSFIKSDYTEFSRAVLDRVGSLVAEPSSCFGRVEFSGLIQRTLISLE